MKKILLAALSLALVTLAGCGVKQTSGTGKLRVVASFYPLAFLSEQIGGDLVSVTQVTPGGVEPHEYDPSPQELTKVHDANIFIMNGEGVDAWGDKVIDALKQSSVVTVRMTDTIAPLSGFNEEGEEDPTNPSSADANVSDPHIWLDPVLVEREVTLIRDALVQADAAHADVYRNNADALTTKLKTLDQEYRDGLAHCALKDAVTSHNAFRYMAKEYGFQTLAIAGIDAEQEPSPKRIAELAELAKKQHIKYIFFETLVSPKIAETLANEIGAESLVLNPIEGLTADDSVKGRDYFSIMRDNLQNLRTALQCQ